jgi:hypothetical protein
VKKTRLVDQVCAFIDKALNFSSNNIIPLFSTQQGSQNCKIQTILHCLFIEIVRQKKKEVKQTEIKVSLTKIAKI